MVVDDSLQRLPAGLDAEALARRLGDHDLALGSNSIAHGITLYQ
jgi:hypothetical protein